MSSFSPSSASKPRRRFYIIVSMNSTSNTLGRFGICASGTWSKRQTARASLSWQDWDKTKPPEQPPKESHAAKTAGTTGTPRSPRHWPPADIFRDVETLRARRNIPKVGIVPPAGFLVSRLDHSPPFLQHRVLGEHVSWSEDPP